MKNLLERNTQHIFGTLYNPYNQDAVEAFQNNTRFLTLSKDQKKYYSQEDSICDFLLYYNDRLHSTIKVVLYRAMMEVKQRNL